MRSNQVKGSTFQTSLEQAQQTFKGSGPTLLTRFERAQFLVYGDNPQEGTPVERAQKAFRNASHNPPESLTDRVASAVVNAFQHLEHAFLSAAYHSWPAGIRVTVGQIPHPSKELR